MGSTNQAFVLRWNDFHSNITTSFKNIRDCDEFFDVTVSVDEEHQVLAHKVILAACSPYFRAMLKKNPAKHPVLIMPGTVRYQEICPMIDFMYHGEVSIPTEDLDVFLKTANQFKVKGLTEQTEDRSKQNNQRQGKMPGMQPRPIQQPGSSGMQPRLPAGTQMVKRPMMGHGPTQGKRPRMSQPSPVRMGGPGSEFPGEPEDEDDDVTEIREGDSSNDYFEGYEEQYDDGSVMYDEGQAAANQATAQSPGGPQLMGLLCPQCRTMCQGVKALKDHMAVCGGGAVAGPSQAQYPPANAPVEDPQSCEICDKSFKSHRTLENHMKKQHKINPPPKPHTPKGPRGRPKKAAAMEGEGEAWQEQQYTAGYQETSQMGKQSGELNRRPVGQVAPAQRTIRQGQSPTPVKQEKMEGGAGQSMGRGMTSPRGRGRGGAMGRGAPRPGPSREGPGGRTADLQKLGLKFGNQISITSSGNQGKGGPGGGDGDGRGVSITKLKGDVPVSAPMPIKDATARPGRRVAPQGQGGGGTPRSQSRDAPPDVQIKEEPTNLFEEGAEEVEDPDMQGDYFEEYEGEYEGDGMYEEEYEEGGEEGDDSFNGRSGMFQGGFERGYEEDPDMEGAYEEEG